MISKEKKTEIIAAYGRKPGDTGSPEDSDRNLNRKNCRTYRTFKG